MFSFVPKPKRVAARTLAGLLCLALAVLFLACPMEGGGGGGGETYTPQPQQIVYPASADSAGNIYELTIKESVASARYTARAGDTYTLKITFASDGSVKISTGTVASVNGITVMLTPTNAGAGEGLTLEISGGVLQKIEGTVTFDGDTTTAAIPAAAASLAAIPAVPVIAGVTSGNGSLTVTWGAAAHATGYAVYVDAGAAIPASPTDTVTVTSATITGLANGTIYNVWVKAVNGSVYSAPSDPIAGAPWDPSLLNDFVGIWDSYSDGYVISASGLEYDDGSDGVWGMSFAGDIKFISEYATDKGVIIIEYTEDPLMPYTLGSSNYEGIYYQKEAGGIKLANAYDGDATASVQDLNAAIVRYSQANEATFVYDWSGVYVQYKQPGTVFDMGALRGVWNGDDDVSIFGMGASTILKINDYRLTVYYGAISPVSPAYSGAIVDRTDPNADTGYIYIQFTGTADDGMVGIALGASQNDYYAIYWYTDSGKKYFSVYNDHLENTDSSLTTLKTKTALNPYFLEYTHGDYDGEGDGMNTLAGGNEGVYVGFTK